MTLDPKLDLQLERIIDVSPELVWACWTEPEHIKKWFCPAPWSVSDCELDLRPGGIFRTTMRSPRPLSAVIAPLAFRVGMLNEKAVAGPMCGLPRRLQSTSRWLRATTLIGSSWRQPISRTRSSISAGPRPGGGPASRWRAIARRRACVGVNVSPPLDLSATVPPADLRVGPAPSAVD